MHTTLYPLPYHSHARQTCLVCSDGSGSIDRNEFLQIPQIANNPLASRMIAIFDEECVVVIPPLARGGELLKLSLALVAVVALSTFRNSLEV